MENIKSGFSQKLDLILKLKNISQKELSRISGVSSASISSWIAGHKVPKIDSAVKIAHALQVDLRVLVDDNFSEKELFDITDKTNFYEVIGGQNLIGDFIFLPMLDEKLDDNKEIVIIDNCPVDFAFRKRFLSLINQNHESLFLFKISGESMYPSLKQNDIVLIDTGKTDIVDAKIYAFVSDKTINIKRFESRGKNLLIISDNQQYQPYEISPDEIRIIGQVVWHISAL